MGSALNKLTVERRMWSVNENKECGLQPETHKRTLKKQLG